MKLRLTVVAGLVLLASAFIPQAGARASTAPCTPAPQCITFTHEVTVDPQRADGEPDLAIANNGTDMYTSGPWGFSTTTSFAWKSSDTGVQWTNLHGGASSPAEPGANCPAVGNPLRPFCSRGGGDTEIQLGSPQGMGQPQAAFFVDLNGLDTLSCAWSTDGADTFHVTGLGPSGLAAGQVCNTPAPAPSGTPPQTNTPGSDRQWIAVCHVGDPCAGNATSDQLYLVYDNGDTPPGNDSALRSTDGGHTWFSACNLCVGTGTKEGARPGPVIINTATGALYEFMGTTAGGTIVNVSCDQGATWTTKAIAPDGSLPTTNSIGTTNDFVVGAIDSAGGLYATWTVDNNSGNTSHPWRVYYTHSSDPNGTSGIGNCGSIQGGSWSPAVNLTGPATTAAVDNRPAGLAAPLVNFGVMPWIAVGSPGRVDIGYYGSTDPLPSDPSVSNETWLLHMAQSLDGQNMNPPFSDTVISETPMHKQSICFGGLGCQLQVPAGDRNLIDFFEVKADPISGRAVIIFTDDNNSAAGPAVGNNGAGIVSSVQQATGPGLYAGINSGFVTPLPLGGLGQSLDIRNEVTDPCGDAGLAAVGHNLPAATGCGTNGNVNAADITDLKVLNKDPNTLEFLFKVHDLSAGPGSAAIAPHTGARWLATWHWNNDLWFAQFTSDPSSMIRTCLAGKPVSLFSSSAPKALQYAAMSGQNTTLPNSACVVDQPNNTIEIDVPLSSIGGVGTAGDTTNHVLYGLTGYTGDNTATIPSVDTTGNLGTSGLAFYDNIDQTAPIDALVGTPGSNILEAPAVPLIAGFGLLAVAGGAYLRRRRLGTRPLTQ
jgi:hypothetical protein